MNEMINNFQIVVSRFNENINWLSNFKNITIVYNKGNNDKHLNDFNEIALFIALLELISKFILYYVHERIWIKIPLGLKH